MILAQTSEKVNKSPNKRNGAQVASEGNKDISHVKNTKVTLESDNQKSERHGILKSETKVVDDRSKLLLSPDLSDGHLAPDNDMDFSIPQPPIFKKE